MKIASIEKIVAYLRAQARMRAEENDEAGILLDHAFKIETEVADLYHPRPFAGLDACETE
jgi:hypothetical protein